jgi:S1-C subfamily serine protease
MRQSSESGRRILSLKWSLCLLLLAATAFAQQGGPPENFVRYEHQQSPNGQWQLDFYEDPGAYKRQIWISPNNPSAVRQKLYAHDIQIQTPVLFSPDETLVAINHGSWAWGMEPAFVRITSREISLIPLADNEFQSSAVRAVEHVGKLPKGAEPVHIYCHAVKCVDNENVEVRILLDCQPSPTTRWIGPFFFRYNVDKQTFSPSQLTASERSAKPEPPQMAFEGLKSSGTGFVIAPSGYVVTNEHVIRGATRIRVRTKVGLLPCTIAASNANADLAILKIEDGTSDGTFPYLELIDSQQIRLGQNVFTVGFPNPDVQGLNPKFTSGQISSLTGIDDDPKRFQISTPLQPGNSGGALVTESGDVAGIVCGSLNAIEMARRTGTLPQNVDYAIKSEQLAPLLQEIPRLRPIAFKKQASPLPYEQAIARAQDASVRVLTSGFPKKTAIAPQSPPGPTERRVQTNDKEEALRKAKESDDRLNAAYAVLRSRLNSAGKKELRDEQKLWLQTRAAETGSDELLAQGMAAEIGALKRFTEMNDARTRALQETLQHYERTAENPGPIVGRLQFIPVTPYVTERTNRDFAQDPAERHMPQGMRRVVIGKTRFIYTEGSDTFAEAYAMATQHHADEIIGRPLKAYTNGLEVEVRFVVWKNE